MKARTMRMAIAVATVVLLTTLSSRSWAASPFLQPATPFGAASATTTYTPPFLPPVTVQQTGRPLLGGRTTVVAPTVSYRPVVSYAPTTSFRPVVSRDACTGTAVTTFMPTVAYRPQVQSVPHLAYDLPPRGLLEWLFPWRRTRIIVAPTAPAAAAPAPIQTAMAAPVAPATYSAPIVSDPAAVRPTLTTPGPAAPPPPAAAAPPPAQTFADEYYTPAPPQPDPRMRPVPPAREEIRRVPLNDNDNDNEPAIPDWKQPRALPSNASPSAGPERTTPEDRIASQGAVRLVSYRPANWEPAQQEPAVRQEPVRQETAPAAEPPLDFSGWRSARP